MVRKWKVEQETSLGAVSETFAHISVWEVLRGTVVNTGGDISSRDHLAREKGLER